MNSKKGGENKRNERGEEKGFRANFVRLFGRYDFRDEEQFLRFGKWLIYSVLLMVNIFLLLKHVDEFETNGGYKTLIPMLSIISALSVSVALQLFVVKQRRGRKVLYIIEALVACGFPLFSDGTSPILIYMLVLTLFYFEMNKTKNSVWSLITGGVLYMVAYSLQMRYRNGVDVSNLFQLLRETFGALFALFTHFVVIQIILAFYRQYLKLDRTLAELDESKKALEKAYAVVAEVTALEERQRIAKEIHDVAGHSLTTVIMQTESAKRIVESSPAEAKTKIVAANLQAKHALEELRTSVHLLSGAEVQQTLKASLLGIIHESTDGTGIVIRSEIAELSVSPAKHRFLCNTLKEGISNALRHGNATAFWFECKEEDGKICFLLSDNGKGVEDGKLELGFGLSTMKERALALGGEVEILTDIEEGFELRITLPKDEK